MKEYLDLVADILDNGHNSDDRTGTGTLSVFTRNMRFDLARGFPMVTTKKLYFKGIVGELLWFLSGDTNIKWLNDNQIHIWDEWATDQGDIGPLYGAMWRSWPSHDGTTIDQISDVINEIKTNPNSRRLIVSTWNPAVLPDPAVSPAENAANGKQALPPCHTLFHFYARDGKLSCHLYQRSADIFLGVPFNIASYALLTHMIAAECGLEAGEFVWTGGDCHIYNNHLDQMQLQLSRDPRPLPKLVFNKKDSIFDYTIDDFSLEDYDAHPHIPGKVSV